MDGDKNIMTENDPQARRMLVCGMAKTVFAQKEKPAVLFNKKMSKQQLLSSINSRRNDVTDTTHLV